MWKEILQVPSNKTKDMLDDPFEVLEKVGDNAYKLNLPPYTHIYSVLNVENLNLYEHFVIDEENVEQFSPTIEELTPYSQQQLG
jgi:hypothetical protein